MSKRKLSINAAPREGVADAAADHHLILIFNRDLTTLERRGIVAAVAEAIQ